jgi:hypothetical protein
MSLPSLRVLEMVRIVALWLLRLPWVLEQDQYVPRSSAVVRQLNRL